MTNLAESVYLVNMVNEKKLVMAARVSPGLAAIIRKLAEKKNRTVSYIIEEVLRKALSRGRT